MKIYRLSGKTWRDKAKKNFITLYHFSPEHLTKLMPRSKLLNTGKVGLFMSPSYKSAISDWAGYVMGRKNSKHQLAIQREKLFEESDKLEENLKNNPNQEALVKRIEEIKTKLERLNETTKMENKAYWNSIKGYKNIFLHTIQCPREIYEDSEKMMKDVYKSDPVKNFGFWSWEAQIFIEGKYLSQLSISNVKKLNVSQFSDEYRNVSFNRFLDNPNRLYNEQFKREEEQRKRKQEEERAKDTNPNRYDYKKEMEQRRKEFEEYRKKNQLY